MPSQKDNLSERELDEVARFLATLNKEAPMEYRSQKIAYWYFAAALPLFVLQVVVGSGWPPTTPSPSRSRS